MAAPESSRPPLPLPSSPLLPIPPPGLHGPAPELTQGTPCQGRTLSGKFWSEDLIILPALRDPLGLPDVPPPEDSVDVSSEARPGRHRKARCALEPPPPPPAGKSGQLHGSLCQTAQECQSVP